MNGGDFHVDEKTNRLASELTADLQFRTVRLGDLVVEDFIYGESYTRSPGVPFDEVAGPLDRVSEEKGIPLQDVRADLEDFTLLAPVAQRYGIPALILGEARVPVLPGHGILRSILEAVRRTRGRTDSPWLWIEAARSYLQDAFAGENAPQEVQTLNLEEAQTAFFRGLSSYIAVRIAGVPWLQGQMPSKSGGQSNGQWWKAETQRSGLSLYYAGTHAVRHPPNYLGGVTTPLPVFLPLGTLHLGADAGRRGRVLWDSSVVTVPSHTPIFRTKKF